LSIRSARRNVRSLFWSAVFTAHLLGAIGWWWFLPGGFPVDHPRFWANTGFPILFGVVAVLGLAGQMARQFQMVQFCATVLAAFWTAAGMATLVLYPASRKSPALLALAVAALLWLRWRAWRKKATNAAKVTSTSAPATLSAGAQRLPLGIAVLCGAFLGVAAPWTQRGPVADTHPAVAAFPPLPADDRAAASPSQGIELCDQMVVTPSTGQFRARLGGLSLEIAPLLSFHSRSPDRFWTLLAKPADRIGPTRRLLGRRHSGHALSLRYHSDGSELLEIVCADDGSIDISAHCTLPREVYSHLNSFADLTVYGHQTLSLEFSPCPGVPIEVTPSDYPVGRPRRFAYLSPGGEFRVVEATSGEKGPFRHLASGLLKPGDPLTIMLCDSGRPRCSVTLLDWSAQCSTQLSPAAGWGVPVNAIEFTREGNAPSAPAAIWITLAGTSIGRGFDSVGHAAGVYRNRMRIEEGADGINIDLPKRE